MHDLGGHFKEPPLGRQPKVVLLIFVFSLFLVRSCIIFSRFGLYMPLHVYIKGNVKSKHRGGICYICEIKIK